MSFYQLPTKHANDVQLTIGSFRDFYAFEQHVITCRRKRGLDVVPQWYEQPVFYFSNATSIVGDTAEIEVPANCDELDYELELGVVIGKAGRNISLDQAWQHVAGFVIVNDFSARDIQRQEMAVGLGPAKGKDFATSVGPVLVPLGELQHRINDQQKIDMAMSAWVNGRQLSQGNASSMYFSWPQLIHRASQNATLYPGDLLGSGTVGTGCILELGPENTGGWLQPGDQIELNIDGLGTLVNTIVDSKTS